MRHTVLVASALMCAVSTSALSSFSSPRTTQPTALGMLGTRSSNPQAQDVPVRIEGNTMKTWKVEDDTKKIHVRIGTSNRPANGEINLWHGPNYSPTNVKVYLQDGTQNQLSLVLKPKGHGLDTIQVLNTAQYEYPLTTSVGEASEETSNSFENLVANGQPRLIQGGGSVKWFPIDPMVQKVQIAMVATEGRNVKVLVELLQGPNNVKQSVEFYASNAYKTPFYIIFDTPASGYQVRIKNKYPVEFPLMAYIEPLA